MQKCWIYNAKYYKYFAYGIQMLYHIPYVQLKFDSWSYVGAFEKLRKVTIRFVMSVCPHGTTRFPLPDFHVI